MTLEMMLPAVQWTVATGIVAIAVDFLMQPKPKSLAQPEAKDSMKIAA